MVQKKIACIGGGTGTFVVLKGLKHYHYDIRAIVTMSDSGGSNKRLRDEFGLLPTSDIRQCLVALSDENGGVGILRKLFMYRFEKGNGISGMTFGNLFMAALSDILGSQEEAIAQTSKVLRIHGIVIPVSFTDTNLFATYEDGHTVSEEHVIDEPPHDGRMRITDIYLKPKAKANPEAIQAIAEAAAIILGPGDLYTSVIPNFLVDTIPEAIKKAKGKKIYIVNLMTKFGQTYQYGARDHMKAIEDRIGPLDYVLVNTSPLPKPAVEAYAKYHEDPVLDDLPGSTKVLHADLVNTKMIKKAKSDTLVRSLIRHDSIKLAKVISALIG